MVMKALKLMVLISMMLFVSSSVALAGDYDWMKNLNTQASLDPTGFRAQIATRFKVGDTQVTAVLGNMKEPANAYMVFRLGEMSHHPVERVIDVYNKNQGKGWGVIAKELGIKPGSAEFHALKRGHDLGGNYGKGKKDAKDKDKGKDKGKGKGKGKK